MIAKGILIAASWAAGIAARRLGRRRKKKLDRKDRGRSSRGGRNGAKKHK